MSPGRRPFSTATIRRSAARCAAGGSGGALVVVGVSAKLQLLASPGGGALNVVCGLVGLLAAWRGAAWSVRYLITAGFVYAAVWTYQMAADPITSGLRWDQPQLWFCGVVGGSLLVAGIVGYLVSDVPD